MAGADPKPICPGEFDAPSRSPAPPNARRSARRLAQPARVDRAHPRGHATRHGQEPYPDRIVAKAGGRGRRQAHARNLYNQRPACRAGAAGARCGRRRRLWVERLMRGQDSIVGQWRGRLAALLLSLALAACGGGGSGGGRTLPAATGRVAVISAAGGETNTDGAGSASARALAPADGEHRQDSGRAAPPMLVPLGAYLDHATRRRLRDTGGGGHPVERRNLADNEQLLLVTAGPGDSRWRDRVRRRLRQRRAARVGGTSRSSSRCSCAISSCRRW